jgi:hypothetical protein
MAYLLTDAREYRHLPCPGTVTIGRGTDNAIRPESQSASKNHAIITISKVADTGKFEVWLEDLNSRNGTFVGESPLDFERVNGRRRLHFGEYIRFGHSQKFFRLVDQIPVDNESEIIPIPSSVPITAHNNFGSNLNAGGLIRDSKDETRVYGDSKMLGSLSNQMNGSLRRPGTANSNGYSAYQQEEDNDDFNLVLKYNTKRNQASQPVSLFIGGSENGSARQSVSQEGRQATLAGTRGADRYVNNTYEDSGKAFNNNNSNFSAADPKVQFQLDDVDQSDNLFDGSKDNYARVLANSSSMEALQEMRSVALREIGDSKDIIRNTELSTRSNPPASDHLPKFFFHAYVSPIFTKENVLKYLAGLRDWEQYVMKGIDPTTAKVDIFFRQLLEEHSSNSLTTRGNREIIEIPKIVQLYQRLSPPEKESLSAELIVDTIHASAADNQSLFYDMGQSIIALQALNRSCRLGINEDDRSQFNRYGEVDMALMEEITRIVKREMHRLSHLESSQLSTSMRAIAGSGHAFNIERLFYQSNNILLGIQSFLGSVIQEERRSLANSYTGIPPELKEMQITGISASDCFEVVSLCLLEILWRMWQAYSSVLCLLAIVQEMVTQKVLEGGGSIAGAEGRVEGLFGAGATTMPNLQLLREKMMNGDEESVLQVLTEFKQQHVNTAFQRFGR